VARLGRAAWEAGGTRHRGGEAVCQVRQAHPIPEVLKQEMLGGVPAPHVSSITESAPRHVP
jgi:hypothetical protein